MKTKNAKNMKDHMLKTLLLATLLGCLAMNASAEVQITRFDPPLNISAFADVPEALLVNVMAVDFNVDGDAEFRLAYGYGWIGAYLNTPTRFGRRAPRPGVVAIGGPVAAVPLCSIIGGNIVSAIATNSYVWSPGYTNRYDLTQPLGNHEASVITANLSPAIGPVITFPTNGVLVTNIYYPRPVVSGDVAGKEAVMAVEVQINGETHYGYIHFDFRSSPGTPFGGAGGLIHGWAYETQPGVPIQAFPLSSEEDHRDRRNRWDDRDRGDNGNRRGQRTSR